VGGFGRVGDWMESGLNSRARQIATTHLRHAGVRAFVTPRGAVRGQALVHPERFSPIDGRRPEAEHAFVVLDGTRLRFLPSSSFHGLGPVDYVGFDGPISFEKHLHGLWSAFGAQQSKALEAARALTPSAHVETPPWRIIGNTSHAHERLQLLFSPDGRRAVITAVGARPVSAPPVEPRVVLPSDPRGDEVEALWDAALAQALRHAPDVEDLAAATALSIDLGSGDLHTVDPGQGF